MKKSEKLIFFGNERLATGVKTSCLTLKALIENGYEIAAVVCSFTAGNSRGSRELEISEVAKQNNIPLLLPNRVADIKQQLEDFDSVAAVLVAYGQIIPAEIIDIFPRGIINIHPSLLPKFRGPSPIEQVILEGIEVTGVSLMQLSSKMDEGPIFDHQIVYIADYISKQGLADLLLEKGYKLLIEKLPAILEGKLKPKPQPGAEATYTKLINKADGLIDWSKPAVVLEREVRAYRGWPKSTTKILNRDVIITRSRVAEDEADGDLVKATGDGWLEVLELTGPSGRTMSGTDFLRGYRNSI